jgi:hypothetical protein
LYYSPLWLRLYAHNEKMFEFVVNIYYTTNSVISHQKLISKASLSQHPMPVDATVIH